MDDTVEDPLINRLIDERYRVIERLASGGMARVYLATDIRLEREVALKIMHAHLADNEVFRSRFQREARAAARLSHPAVVGVYDQGIDGDTVYLAMELIAGHTVRDYLNKFRILSLEQAYEIMEPVLQALAAAHDAGLIHRDVKPENVLISSTGAVKVADFGLARAVSDATASSTNSVLGTVAYLSPELLSRGIADERSDVYAVGVLLHEMLTGSQPHGGETPIQVAYQHVHEDLPSALEKSPWLDPEVDALIARFAARDPDERPRNGREALEQLREIYAGVSPEQRAHAPAPPPAPPRESETDTAVSMSAPPRSTSTPSDETIALNHAQTTRQPSAAPPPPGQPPAPASQKNPPNPRKKKREKRSDAHPGSQPKKRRRPSLWLIVLLLLIFLLGGTSWWYFFHGPGSYTLVPNVLGAPANSATKVLAEHDLGSKQVEEFNDDTPEGYVIITDPKPDANVKKDSVITMTVSKGPEYFEIPDVVDMSAQDALTELRDLGLRVEVDEKRPWHEKVAADHVLGVHPEVGTEVTRRDEITLTVSAGREPIEVPLTVNMTREDAVAAIESADLEVKIEEEYSDTLAAGHVLAQEPSSGTLHRGDVVEITVSLGPELIEVPNVLGKQVDEATEELRSRGFEVKTRQMNDWWIWGERVSDQSPRGGEKIRPGEEVVLTLS